MVLPFEVTQCFHRACGRLALAAGEAILKVLEERSAGPLQTLLSLCESSKSGARNAAGALVAAPAAHRHSPKPQQALNFSVNEPTTKRHERPSYAFSQQVASRRLKLRAPFTGLA